MYILVAITWPIEKKNQEMLAKKNARIIFITSCENLDYGVEKFL